MLKSRKALSEVVSTVIIAGSLLIMAAIASWLAVSLFEVQSQQAEVERAKEAFLNLAEAIEEVAAKPGASAYVRFSPRAGGVEIQQKYATVTVTIDGNTYSHTTAAIRYRGGPYASISSKVVLRGGTETNSLPLIVMDSGVPIAWVYTDPSKGKYVYLDTARVKITELGEITVNGDTYKVVEVLFIKLEYGSASAAAIVDTKVSCVNKTVNVISGSGISITVNGETHPLGGDCVVYFVVSTVRVDFL
ncbi:MAG: hypothetical protein QXI36_01075 [Candidatus Bathyarchaeia archaeon]